MEEFDAHQLPEVDSLPDGFVDSSTEPPAPATPTVEQEKPLGNHQEGSISKQVGTGHAEDESKICLESTVITEKPRSFPVSLSENDNASLNLTEESNKSIGLQGGGDMGVQSSTNLSPEALDLVSECGDSSDQIKGNCESSERTSQEGSDLIASHAGEISSSVRLEKDKKPETTETKRKNPKRTFKSEKEYQEFTLKHQQVVSERDAAIAVRDKLESLCRELQRQNKILMEECKRVSTEGQNLRLDLSTKFQDAIKDVSSRLEEQKEESLAQLKENEMLRNKLKQLVDHYALSEQQYAQKLKQKNLELQLSELKIKQHEEKLIQEQSQMKIYAEQVSELLATEKNLRLQLTADGEKFQQFQDALLKSNEVFETFKQEIEKMAKSIKELKKENTFLRDKCEKTDVTLIELVEERERLKKQLEKTKNQKEKLESLCRSLQEERKQNAIVSRIPDSVPE